MARTFEVTAHSVDGWACDEIVTVTVNDGAVEDIPLRCPCGHQITGPEAQRIEADALQQAADLRDYERYDRSTV